MSKPLATNKKVQEGIIKLYNLPYFSRSDIFGEQPNLAWQVLEQQCNIYTNPHISVEQINKLNSIYCKIVLKLNDLQDQRQKYFNNKMQKLMAQPFIIRCYNETASQQKKKNADLQQKRKQLEEKLSIKNQNQINYAFQLIIQNQNQKEKKLQSKIQELLEEHQKNLQNRLQCRSMKKLLISPLKKNQQHSTISSFQAKNPNLESPQKTFDIENLALEFKESPSQSSQTSSNRPLSERVFNYKFSKIQMDESSQSSQDEHQIQKRIKREKK